MRSSELVWAQDGLYNGKDYNFGITFKDNRFASLISNNGQWNSDFLNRIGCVGVIFFGKRITVSLLWSKVKEDEVCYLVDFSCGEKLRIVGTRETVNILVFEPDPMR